MASCAGITVGSVFDCANPLVPFVRQRLLLGNLEDIDTITRSVVVGEENIITAITMKSTKAMFAFDGSKNSVTAQVSLVAGGFVARYAHQVGLIVWEVDAAQKINLQGMAAVNLFGIVENSQDDSLGNSVFEVYGINAGIQVSEMIRINADAETGAGYVTTIVNPDEQTETTLPESFFVTDLATTIAAVDALLVPAL